MGLYGNYCAVEPAELEAHRGDYWAWWRLYEPTDYEGRTFTLDRLWDAVWYVLDPARRGAPPSVPGAPMGVAVVGARLLNEEETRRYEPFTTGIINQSRYLSPPEVRSASAALARVTEAAVREAFDPTSMEGAHVYRVATVERVVEAVVGLRAFYACAAEEGAAVTVRIS